MDEITFEVSDEDMKMLVAAGVGFAALLLGEAEAMEHSMENIDLGGGINRLLDVLETINTHGVELEEAG